MCGSVRPVGYQNGYQRAEMQLFRDDARDRVRSVREAMRDDLGTPRGWLSSG